MVRVAAEAVAELTAVVRERVDHAVLVQQRERPVHGGEADLRAAAAAQPAPQRLGSDVVGLAPELGQDLDALSRRPHTLRVEQLGSVGLRDGRHALYASTG